VERAAGFAWDGLKTSGIGEDAVGVEVGEDVERGVEAGDLGEVGFSEIEDGDLAGAKEIKLADRGLKDELGHGLEAWMDAGLVEVTD
jgi:hypothetical protein